MLTDILDEHAVSIFRVEEHAKQQTSVKQLASIALAWLILQP
jgi:hypothetical protein